MSHRNCNNNSRSSNSSSRGRRRASVANLPLEQGIICTLKESFGFIHCAERPEEVFFHYSELQNVHADQVHVDTEVEFKIGPSEKDPNKLAAYEVMAVPEGTVVWETEETPGQLYQGLLERPVRNDGRGPPEGSIQVVETQSNNNNDDDDGGNDATKKKGPMVRYRIQDYDPSQNAEGLRGAHRLFKGDLVQFRLLFDRRTKQKYARSITLLQTEKERTRLETEKRLMATAVEEEGVVIALNNGYGFLQSNRRPEHVYFHYSHLILPEHAEDFDLKKGQEMRFLVVTEDAPNGGGGGGGKQKKCSARKLTCLPKGSVMFHKMVQKGVQGIVTLCPRPPSGNSSYADDKDGTIRLVDPISFDGQSVEDVSLQFSDVPGGVYSFSQRGSTVNGLWIQDGDTLLFDVVQELCDGSFRAAPTFHTLGNDGALVEPTQETMDEEGLVRLVATSLVSRAEGILHTVKVQGGYGFIHYAERPVDVHFQTYNIFPEELQADLRRQLGYDDAPVPLEVGVDVHFDICAHGNIPTVNRKRGQRGRSPPRNHDRENLKAHRVLLLPPSSIMGNKALAVGERATVSMIDKKQLYAGFVDLEREFSPMSLEERHPLVAKMVESFVEESSKPSGRKSLVYMDVMSMKDDDVIVEMIKARGAGLLTYDHIPVAGMDGHPGRLIIKRVESTSEPEGEHKESPAQGQTTKKKANKNIRFDKSCMAEESKEDIPPGIGDVVECDVLQSRRTGKFLVQNVKVVERKQFEGEDPGEVEATGVGIVKEVVPKRGFGFISLLDENANKSEILFFNLSDSKDGKTDFRQGDEVKFDVVAERNGKRVAKSIEVAPKGTIRAKASKNACRGIILMEPSHTSLSDTPLRKKKSNDSLEGQKTGRWGDVTAEDRRKAEHKEIVEDGFILLTEDNYGLFNKENRTVRSRSTSVDSVGSSGSLASVDGANSDADNGLETDGSVLSRLPYKNGGVAIHGVGAALPMDSKTNPRRGDLVSFVKSKKGRGARDIRVEKRQAATLLRGRLENIKRSDGSDSKSGVATFVAATEKGESFDIDLAEVISCDISLVKENQSVEGICHEGKIFGVCRTTDLYLESKLGTAHKERPKLNLTVRRNRGGTIMAQSGMAKGPDKTIGFPQGWTTRSSQYAQLQTEATLIADEQQENVTE